MKKKENKYIHLNLMKTFWVIFHSIIKGKSYL